MGLCKDCQFWDDKYWHQEREERMLGLRKCSRVPLLFDVIEYLSESLPIAENGIRLQEEAQGLKAFTQDGSDYRADFLTMADFGCVQFEPIP